MRRKRQNAFQNLYFMVFWMRNESMRLALAVVNNRITGVEKP